jgi:hypothetical protein
VLKASLKRAAAAASVAGIAMAIVATATPAFAVSPAQPEIITAVGSDTTEEFMRSYLGTAPAANDFNVPAKPAAAFAVPADAGAGANCPARTYTQAGVAPDTVAPNGSGAGITALNNSVAAGDSCIDIARSSRGRAVAEVGGPLRFHAFAIDHVSLATPSFNAPAAIDQVALSNIYQCINNPATGAPYTWADVGGQSAPGATGAATDPIIPFLPQSGSGTRNFFVTQVLGLPQAFAFPACVIQTVQENTGKDATMVGPGAAVAGRYQRALVPYSTGQWIFQSLNAANPAVDVRNGMRLMGLKGACGQASSFGAVYGFGGAARWFPNAAPFGATPVLTEANANAGAVGCGVRFVYNVTHTGSVQFAAAEQHVGTGSVLCTGGSAGVINSNGFAPLSDDDPTAAVHTCRDL